MSSVSTVNTAAFYQIFRDREAKNSSSDADASGTARAAGSIASKANVDKSDDVTSSKASDSDSSHPSNRLHALIDAQVSSGKLTTTQGDTLKTVLGKRLDAAGSSGGSVPSNDGTGGQPSGTKTDTELTPKGMVSSNSFGETQGSGIVLAAFIKNLQSTHVSRSSYSRTGSTGAGTAAGTRVLDVKT